MNAILETIYFISSLTFIIGLKMMSHPDKARKGNLVAAGGMFLAVLGTLLLYHNEPGGHGAGAPDNKTLNLILIMAGIGLGWAVGWIAAKKVKLTAMPQMVSLFNGMGGACAAIISIVEFRHLAETEHNVQGLMQLGAALGHGASMQDMMAQFSTALIFQKSIILVGLIIGSVSFAGSMIAYGKLEGKIKDLRLGGQQMINMGLMLAVLVLGIAVAGGWVSGEWTMWALLAISSVYGILFVMPIGGADMPVVISLLNSFTGVAAACGGFIYDNKVMLTGGILVGSAGTILTVLMCKAMNRSLWNVIVGAMGGGSGASSAASVQGNIKEVSPSDAAVMLNYSQSVVIIPGYGLAVAQAQKTCRELDELLESNGVDVKYAIHPVAGRMPGHMNVLLAEAGVPYNKLVDLAEANDLLENADVAVIIGANDVVNPAALEDPGSPIYGMPILNAHKAKNIIVLKRSMGAGYAGIENALFFYPQNKMLFGDAKDSLQKLVSEVKAL